MKYSPAVLGKISLAMLVMSAFWLLLHQYSAPVGMALCLALFFAILVPATFLISRREIAESRIRNATVLRQTLNGDQSLDSCFEFLGRKYNSSDPGQISGKPLSQRSGLERGELFLAAASIPFLLFTAAGFFLLFLPASELPRLLDGSIGANILSVGGRGDSGPKDYENAAAIASFAFAGAFLFCLRLFAKALISFNLSSITFLRAFGHMVLATLLALVIWRASPDVRASAESVAPPSHAASQSRASAPTQPAPVSGLWLILAFGIGLVPDAAYSWMWRRTRLAFGPRSARAANRAGAAPLTLIEGVDFLTAYRLGELRIAAVQNLAAANPIMLHVETSTCIYSVMDWVAQAQLCSAVGPERFLLFRKINVRTIFDLERAVLDPSTPLGSQQMAGAVLLASDGKTSLLRNFGVRPLDVTYRDFDKALTSWVNVEVIEHLVRVIMDDLHVRRLRLIRSALEASLGAARSEEARQPLKIASSHSGDDAQANGFRRGGEKGAEVPFGLPASRGLQPER
jgi:hypothetical protein